MPYITGTPPILYSVESSKPSLEKRIQSSLLSIIHLSMPPLSDPHEGRGRALLGSAVMFFVLPPVFVVLRLWSRRLKRTPLCFNDYAIILGMVTIFFRYTT